jgi:hypothetical protein
MCAGLEARTHPIWRAALQNSLFTDKLLAFEGMRIEQIRLVQRFFSAATGLVNSLEFMSPAASPATQSPMVDETGSKSSPLFQIQMNRDLSARLRPDPLQPDQDLVTRRLLVTENIPGTEFA